MVRFILITANGEDLHFHMIVPTAEKAKTSVIPDIRPLGQCKQALSEEQGLLPPNCALMISPGMVTKCLQGKCQARRTDQGSNFTMRCPRARNKLFCINTFAEDAICAVHFNRIVATVSEKNDVDRTVRRQKLSTPTPYSLQTKSNALCIGCRSSSVENNLTSKPSTLGTSIIVDDLACSHVALILNYRRSPYRYTFIYPNIRRRQPSCYDNRNIAMHCLDGVQKSATGFYLSTAHRIDSFPEFRWPKLKRIRQMLAQLLIFERGHFESQPDVSFDDPLQINMLHYGPSHTEFCRLFQENLLRYFEYHTSWTLRKLAFRDSAKHFKSTDNYGTRVAGIPAVETCSRRPDFHPGTPRVIHKRSLIFLGSSELNQLDAKLSQSSSQSAISCLNDNPTTVFHGNPTVDYKLDNEVCVHRSSKYLSAPVTESVKKLLRPNEDAVIHWKVSFRILTPKLKEGCYKILKILSRNHSLNKACTVLHPESRRVLLRDFRTYRHICTTKTTGSGTPDYLRDRHTNQKNTNRLFKLETTRRNYDQKGPYRKLQSDVQPMFATLRAEDVKRLSVFDHRCLRSIARIWWEHRISNAELQPLYDKYAVLTADDDDDDAVVLETAVGWSIAGSAFTPLCRTLAKDLLRLILSVKRTTMIQDREVNQGIINTVASQHVTKCLTEGQVTISVVRDRPFVAKRVQPLGNREENPCVYGTRMGHERKINKAKTICCFAYISRKEKRRTSASGNDKSKSNQNKSGIWPNNCLDAEEATGHLMRNNRDLVVEKYPMFISTCEVPVRHRITRGLRTFQDLTVNGHLGKRSQPDKSCIIVTSFRVNVLEVVEFIWFFFRHELDNGVGFAELLLELSISIFSQGRENIVQEELYPQDRKIFVVEACSSARFANRSKITRISTILLYFSTMSRVVYGHRPDEDRKPTRECDRSNCSWMCSSMEVKQFRSNFSVGMQNLACGRHPSLVEEINEIFNCLLIKRIKYPSNRSLVPIYTWATLLTSNTIQSALNRLNFVEAIITVNDFSATIRT
ncbi:hypothetical protein CLF_107687, partial [Clonorchis sinensis]